jgi:hypothetical protein
MRWWGWVGLTPRTLCGGSRRWRSAEGALLGQPLRLVVDLARARLQLRQVLTAVVSAEQQLTTALEAGANVGLRTAAVTSIRCAEARGQSCVHVCLLSGTQGGQWARSTQTRSWSYSDVPVDVDRCAAGCCVPVLRFQQSSTRVASPRAFTRHVTLAVPNRDGLVLYSSRGDYPDAVARRRDVRLSPRGAAPGAGSSRRVAAGKSHRTRASGRRGTGRRRRPAGSAPSPPPTRRAADATPRGRASR